jgi:hypothetical protein
MFPALIHPTTEAHRDDLYRDARRRHTTEIRVREELRRTRRPAMIHRPRSTLKRRLTDFITSGRDGHVPSRPRLRPAPRG